MMNIERNEKSTRLEYTVVVSLPTNYTNIYNPSFQNYHF